jgi:endonuclease/exonuclease/phosphatase family metal-dependent hydrolase
MRRVGTLALLWWLLGAPVSAALANSLTVMTQNQFLGADLGPVLQAVGTPQQDAVLTATLAQMAANNFPLRAHALAEQICDQQPHVVGLQEVFLFALNGCTMPSCGAPLPFRDHLQVLMAALGAQCGNYVVAASVKHTDVAQAVAGVGTIRFADRDVLLTRMDVAFTPVPFNGAVCAPTADSGVAGVPVSGCPYHTLLPLPPTIGGAVVRGYVGVDVLVEDVPYRVVTTHLEVMFPGPSPESMVFQAAQATELLTVLSIFPQPLGTRLVVLGDFNSSPDDAANGALPFVPPYTQFTTGVDLAGAPLAAPYTDAWEVRPSHQPGFTCCHAADLSIRQVAHQERIDFIFALDAPRKVKARVLGDKPSDRIGGLWPSDHCTVAAELRFAQPGHVHNTELISR